MVQAGLLTPCGGNVISLGVASVDIVPQSARFLLGSSLSVCCLHYPSVAVWVISMV